MFRHFQSSAKWSGIFKEFLLGLHLQSNPKILIAVAHYLKYLLIVGYVIMGLLYLVCMYVLQKNVEALINLNG